MNKKVVAICILVCLTLLIAVNGVASQSAGAIFINADGSVSGTSLIQREDSLYRLTTNIYDTSIVVLRNNIVFDGAGFTLQGAGGWGIPGSAGVEEMSAINLTCSNVVVCNFNILGWQTGILGAYNGNVISNNNVTSTDRAVAIYANDYNITSNYLTNSIYGVCIKGAGIQISRNQIVNNYGGIMISSSSDIVITGNNLANNSTELNVDDSNFEIFHNNFVNGANTTIVTVPSDSHALGFGSGGTLQPWDNGSEGNFWSDYAAKYPHAAEIDHKGIGDPQYLIRLDPTVIDRYPLIAPVSVQNITLPLPSTTPNSPLSPQTSPSPFSTNPSPTVPELTSIAVLALATAVCVFALAFRKHFSFSKELFRFSNSH